MRLAHLFPVGDVYQKSASAHHIVQAGPSLSQGVLDDAEDLNRLGVGIAFAHELSILDGGCPGNVDVGTNAHGAGVTDDRFPRCTAGDVLTCHYEAPPLPVCHSVPWFPVSSQ